MKNFRTFQKSICCGRAHSRPRGLGWRINIHGTEYSRGFATQPASETVSVEKIKDFNEIPEVRGSLLDYTPIRGFDVRYIYKLWNARHEKYGDIYREKIPGQSVMVYCRSREHNKEMFRAEALAPHRIPMGALSRVRKKLNLPDVISNRRGEEWYKLRKVLNPLLLQNHMVWKYTNAQQAVSADFVQYMETKLDKNGEVPDFGKFLSRWALEMIGTVIFNSRIGLLKEMTDERVNEMADGVDKLLAFIAKSLFGSQLWRYFDTKDIRDVTESERRTMAIFREMIKKYSESGKSQTSDSTVMKEVLGSTDINEDERYFLLYDVMSAAIDTTANASALALYCLTLNPNAQEKLRDEVFVSETENASTGRVVDGMEYMNAFMKECIRLFPFTFGVARVYNQEIILSGYRIPAGIVVLNTSNSTQNMNEEYFSDAEEFSPERWLKSQNRSEASENRFMLTGSFGIGANACPGRRFAMQEMKLLLIEILKKYRVEYHHKPIKAVMRTTAVPSEEPRFRFVPL